MTLCSLKIVGMSGKIEETPNGVTLRERKQTKGEENIPKETASSTPHWEHVRSKKTFGKTPDGTGE